jgi:ankyrin repeat protein
MIASHQGQVESVKILLSAGDDALHKADKGATALDLAIHFKYSAVEAVLRAHIANLEAADVAPGLH